MVKSKARSRYNKRKKQNEETESELLAEDEYVVGMSLDVAHLTRPMLSAPIERIVKAKVNVVRKDKVHWVSALLHRHGVSRSLTLLRPQTYLVKVRRSTRSKTLVPFLASQSSGMGMMTPTTTRQPFAHCFVVWC